MKTTQGPHPMLLLAYVAAAAEENFDNMTRRSVLVPATITARWLSFVESLGCRPIRRRSTESPTLGRLCHRSPANAVLVAPVPCQRCRTRTAGGDARPPDICWPGTRNKCGHVAHP